MMSDHNAIPKILHKVWLGGPLPEREQVWLESWSNKMPDWRIKIWGEKEIDEFEIQSKYQDTEIGSYSELSDILRCEILFRYGGIYSDTDVQCLKDLSTLLEGVDCFFGYEKRNQISGAVMGARPRHPFLRKLTEEMPDSFALHRSPVRRGGPAFLTSQLRAHDDGVTLFPIHFFYPFWVSQRETYPFDAPFEQLFPSSYTVHHWRFSWGSPRPG